MVRLFSLLLLPLCGLALILAGLLWSGRELRLRLLGEAAPGRVTGMVLTRNGQHDLINRIGTDVQLTLADGTRIFGSYRDFAPLKISRAATGAAPELLDPNSLSTELRRILDDAVQGDAAIIRWALQRESRRALATDRVLRIEKTETVFGYFGLDTLPARLRSEDGRPVPATSRPSTAKPSENTVRIHAVFDRSDLERVRQNKQETLFEYQYERLGTSITPEKRNFFLFAEPYSTEFRPVFGYTMNGTAYARLSHIGRHGGPTLAIRLFGDCLVYGDRRDSAESVLIANPGPIDGKPLAWFSRVCEGLFAQWGSSTLMVFAGTIFLGVGLIFISLVIWPSRRHPAVN